MRESTLKKIVAAVAVVVLALLAAGLWHVYGGGAQRAQVQSQYTCEKCGNTWAGHAADDPVKCPKCGNLGYMTVWYVCPGCKQPSALQVRTVAHMKTTCRPAGQEAWLPVCPPLLTCPLCKTQFEPPQFPAGYGWAPPGAKSR
jgi:hypothetical protein